MPREQNDTKRLVNPVYKTKADYIDSISGGLGHLMFPGGGQDYSKMALIGQEVL